MGTKYGLFRFADGIDKLLMFLGALGSIGEGLAAPMTMYMLSGAIDAFGTADQSIANEVVGKYGLRLLYVAFGVGFSCFLEGLCWTRTAERQTSRIRMEYLKSVLRQEVGYFDNQDASSTTFQVVSNISAGAHTIQDVIADKIPNSVAQSSALIFGVIVAFLLSRRIALASLPFALGFIIPGVGFGKLMMDMGIKSKDAYGFAGSIIEQAISNIRTVYSYVGEQKTVEKFSRALEESMNLGIKQGLMKGLMIGSMGMIFATWAFQSWVGGLLVTEKGESGGHVFIAGISIVLGGLSCMTALPNVPYIVDASAAAKRIFEMIDRVPEIDSENDKGKVYANVRGQIEFREVYFSYPSRKDEPVLQGLSLKVKPGEKVGLVGGSGSGKSTIVSLIERFYDPVKGDILLDGHRIKRLQLKWLRSQFGLVNQEPVLFATSIKKNILFGKKDAPRELVIKAAKAANAHDFIVEFPQGYDTQVGQLGVQLSGGQKQRIAIARALLRDPRILLLDEATSALDAQSESVVQEAIDQASQGRTTLLIAHRLSSIRNVDKIMVLKSGRVVESGSHEELMQMNHGEGGIYSQMVRLQNSAIHNGYSPDERSPNTITYAPNSPASPFTHALPMSLLSSIQNSPASSFSLHRYESDVKSDYSSSPTPSRWHLLEVNIPEWKRAMLGCIGAVGFGAVQPVSAYCMGALVSAYFEDKSSKVKLETRFYSFIFLSIGIITFLSNILQHYNFAIMGERLTKRIREKLLQNILSFEIGWFDKDENTSAAVCARLSTEANTVRSLVGDRMSLLVQVSANAFLSFALGLIVAWRVASVLIAIQPFIIVSFYFQTVLKKQMPTNAQEAQNEGSQLASEAVVNHRTITAFSCQNRIVDLFEETLRGPRNESIRQSWISGVGLFSSQFLTVAAVALTFWYGGMLMSKGLLSSRQLFLAFFILMSTGKTIADAGTMTSDLSKGSSAVRSVFAILDRKTKIEPDNLEGNKVRETVQGKIEFDDVYFSYPSRSGQMIFHGLSLKIEAGMTMALVGESGSGKSTVIGLIERFYDPLKGSVLIDDYDIKSYNLRELRSQIALVSQQPALFAGTIHENIVYGRDDATDAEIREAAILAHAHEFISSMKDGYKTHCGERGVQLSGGQKQRIAIARAILKNPSILLLDEATNALDSMSENLVQEALDNMMVGRTCVIVAHRLSTIQMADCIAVVKNGKIVEHGSHSELLALGDPGSYYSLVKLQHYYAS
ncbi:UNVERIFIED_CONTAM: ABC transporter B family member 15 [Sesamum radiatum]|uniref:ABC transporter B family member 15 n=1 Tax=Sesamum radiatum TaxID=300843 RepID=A0AAW2JSD9_SESRA